MATDLCLLNQYKKITPTIVKWLVQEKPSIPMNAAIFAISVEMAKEKSITAPEKAP